MTEDASNQDTFQNCLADILIAELAPAPDPAQQRRHKRAAAKWRRSHKPTTSSPPPSLKTLYETTSQNEDTIVESTSSAAKANSADELSEFVEYLSEDLFQSLPPDLQQLDYPSIRNDEVLAATYAPPIPLSTLEKLADLCPTSTLDSLHAYNILAPDDPVALQTFLRHLLTSYVTAATAPPASLPSNGTSARPEACEICGRDWIPLTYHHLIPRGVHAKVRKRGWHEEWRLNSVAWICRACHSMVHRVATLEELARNFWSVELLLEREDVRAFAAWVGGVRWKKR